jgi:hypothetical protein
LAARKTGHTASLPKSESLRQCPKAGTRPACQPAV